MAPPEETPVGYRAMGAKHQLRTLDGVGPASPCEVPWDRMEGNGRVRECKKCGRRVVSVAGMSRADAETLLDEHFPAEQGALYRRADGTLLSGDCPVGPPLLPPDLKLPWKTVIVVQIVLLFVFALYRIWSAASTEPNVGHGQPPCDFSGPCPRVDPYRRE
jgi:hypothetical protein